MDHDVSSQSAHLDNDSDNGVPVPDNTDGIDGKRFYI